MNRALSIVALLSWTCTPTAHAAQEIVMTGEEAAAIGVTVSSPQVSASLSSEAYPARIVIPPAHEHVVAAPQNGLLEHLEAAVGDDVREGQPLAVIRSPDLIVLQQDYLQALSQVALARSEWLRDKQLYQEGIIAERRYLATKNRLDELNAVVSGRRQALLLAGVNDTVLSRLEDSREITDRLVVAAPADGTVLEQMVKVGERMHIADPLYRLASLKQLWIELRAPLEQTRNLSLGAEVVVERPPATARLIAIGADVDPASQTLLLRADVYEGRDRLRPGQFVEARLLGGVQNSFAVPGDAVVSLGGQNYVFVQSASGFRAMPLQVLGRRGEQALVSGELTGEERIAITGIAALKAAWQGLGGGE